MSAIDRLPQKVQSLPSVRALAKRHEATKLALRRERQSRESLARKTVGTQAGAALAGLAYALRPQVGGVPTPMVAALVAGGGALFTGSADLANLANGLAAPVIASAVYERLTPPMPTDTDTDGE